MVVAHGPGPLVPVPKVILTHGRADRQLTLKWLPGCILCVSESQEPLYRERFPDAEYLVHPDTVRGLLPKRMWVHERVGSCWQLDDDITVMVSTFHASKDGDKQIKPKGDFAHSLMDRLADEAADLGVYLFGFTGVSHPLAFDPQWPYRLTGIVYGQGFGWMAGSKLFYSPQVKIAGDYWISLLNAYHHRIVLVDQRWSFVTEKMFTGAGGQAAVRTVGSERDDTELLKRTFGESSVRRKIQRPNLTNAYGATTVAIKGDFQREIWLPW